MRTVHFLLILVLIPALVALGHDIFLFYEQYGIDNVWEDLNQRAEDKGWTSFFASLGYIWTRYHEDSYRMTVEVTAPEDWAYINALLTQKAFFMGLAFAGFWYALTFILKLLSVGSSERKIKDSGRHSRVKELMGRNKIGGGGMKYKRK